jgi:hypothetical protein
VVARHLDNVLRRFHLTLSKAASTPVLLYSHSLMHLVFSLDDNSVSALWVACRLKELSESFLGIFGLVNEMAEQYSLKWVEL